jgi:hypothetical protein
LVLLGLLGLQLVLRPLKHLFDSKNVGLVLHASGVASAVHVWVGRLLWTVGVIDGGLGFQFAGTFPGAASPASASRLRAKIAYGAVGGVVWIVYVGVVAAWAELQRNPTPTPKNAGKEETARLDGRRTTMTRGRATTPNPTPPGTAASSAGSSWVSLPRYAARRKTL